MTDTGQPSSRHHVFSFLLRRCHFLCVSRIFEESEDELREAVLDSMRNLFVPDDDGSSDREQTGGGDCRQVQESPAGVAVGPPAVVPSGGGDSEMRAELLPPTDQQKRVCSSVSATKTD